MTSASIPPPGGPARWPRGYRGVGHETLGGVLLAVYGAVSMPEVSLGPEAVAWLGQVVPDAWYPIARMLELNRLLERNLGASALKQMGREIFRAKHAANLARSAASARDVLYGFDRMYRQANRGEEIGGWSVAEFRPGFAALEKTTPHHCVMEEGILAEALMTLGIPALVRQRDCFRAGADLCVYEVSAPVFDRRWTGEPD